MRESMKKLLATSAIALVALSGAASAQSVLERVLGQIDNATNLASVNGTFANIAENIGGLTEVNTFAVDGTYTSGNVLFTGTSVTQDQFDANIARLTVVQQYASVTGDQVYYNPVDGTVIRSADWSNLSDAQQAEYVSVAVGSELIVSADGFIEVVTDGAAEIALRNADIATMNSEGVTTSYTGGLEGIDGSINNTIDGITDVTQQAIAGSTSASEWNLPTMNFGNMATTALGAVNTGTITLGVNSAIDQASTSTTDAISSVMNQIGGSADTGAIVINVASNMTGVNGSINNVMTEVGGSIGNLSTTALGAVNTGTITSGIDGVITGITGASSGQQTTTQP
jgi:hypothetical protein